jgi:hypothetical protein
MQEKEMAFVDAVLPLHRWRNELKVGQHPPNKQDETITETRTKAMRRQRER